MKSEGVGRVEWLDLTVCDATAVMDFYSEVIGWTSSPVSMGDYSDYSMHDSDGKVTAGICHARGSNAGLPPQWLMYVTVADIAVSIEACVRLGGVVVDGPRAVGADKLCVIRDPAGAVLALYQKSPD